MTQEATIINHNIALLNELFKVYGEKEIAGDQDNPDIVKLFADAGFSGIKDDETAYCAATVLACAKRAGYDTEGATLAARSFLGIGEAVTEPVLGDVVVFWREQKEGWKGHVALFIRKDGDIIHVAGGNQANSINISAYPAHRLLGYRRLNKING